MGREPCSPKKRTLYITYDPGKKFHSTSSRHPAGIVFLENELYGKWGSTTRTDPHFLTWEGKEVSDETFTICNAPTHRKVSRTPAFSYQPSAQTVPGLPFCRQIELADPVHGKDTGRRPGEIAPETRRKKAQKTQVVACS